MRGRTSGAPSGGDSTRNADPNVWGPPLWDLLFAIALKTPRTPAGRAVAEELFAQLEKVLPCQQCRRSYTMYRTQHPWRPHMDAAEWLWTIHDMVNQNLGKICISYQKVVDRHAVFTSVPHPLAVVDLLCIIAQTARPNHAAEFVNTVLRASSACDGLRLLRKAFANINQANRIDEVGMKEALHAAHTFLCQIYDTPPSADVDRFWERYAC